MNLKVKDHIKAYTNPIFISYEPLAKAIPLIQYKKFLENFLKNNIVSLPATGKERGKYKSEIDIIEELDKFKNAVTQICQKIKSLPNNKIPTIPQIKNDALRDSDLTERVITLNIKKSTTLIKTGLSPETTTGHIRQIVGHFFKDNKLILKKFKLMS